ncbi:MAG: YdeI/OmpD-associated family protein [bacterium]
MSENQAQELLQSKNKRLQILIEFEDKKLQYKGGLLFTNKHGHYIYLSKSKQKELGIFPTDYFNVQITVDTSKYGAPTCEEFEAVFYSDPEAMHYFNKLTDGKKRSILFAIARYKNSQTRIDKALLVSDNLKRGVKDPKDWFKKF